MEFVFGTEEYYKKIIDLQDKLRKSEEERLGLEIKFNEILQVMKQEEEEHFRKIRAKYKSFVQEDRVRQSRNDKILQTLERIEDRTAMIREKTEKFKFFQKQYKEYLKSFPPRLQLYVDEERNRQEDLYHRDANLERYPRSNYSEYSEFEFGNPPTPRELLRSRKTDDDANNWKTSKDFENSMKQYQPASTRFLQGGLILPDAESKLIYPKVGERVFGSLDKPRYSGLLQVAKPHEQEFSPYKKVETAPLVDEISKDYIPKYTEYGTSAFRNSDEYKYNETLDTESNKDDELHEEEDKNSKIQDDFLAKSYYNPSIVQTEDTDDLNPQVTTTETRPITADIEKSKELEETAISISKFDKQDNKQQSDLEVTQNQIQKDQEVKKEEKSPMVAQEQNSTKNMEISPKNSKLQENVSSKVNVPLEGTQNRSPHWRYLQNNLSNVRYMLPQQSYPYQQYQNNYPQVASQYVRTRQNSLISQPVNDQLRRISIEEQHQSPVYQVRRPSIQEQPQILIQPERSSCENLNRRLSVQYDEPQQSIAYNENEQFYDENGQLVQHYDENLGTVQYDENEQLVQPYDERLRAVQYDENGQISYDPNAAYDESVHGQMFYDENGQLVQQYLDDGQSANYYDENGQPMQTYDGEQLQTYDQNGQLLQSYDENGQPLQAYDENGQILQTYDENGQLLQSYGEYGQPMHYEDNGQMLQYDENGQLLQTYCGSEEQQLETGISNENDQKMYEYNKEQSSHLPTDKNSNQDPEIMENPTETKEIVEHKEEVESEIKEVSQNDHGKKSQIDDNKDEKQSDPSAAQEEAIDENSLKEEEPEETLNQEIDIDKKDAEEVEELQEKNVKPDKMNVMDVLDTDTESVQQESKISNESDFEFSNN